MFQSVSVFPGNKLEVRLLKNGPYAPFIWTACSPRSRPSREGGWGGGAQHVTTPRAGLCLKGRGAIGAIPERLQSGHGGCESGWAGGGAVTGGWKCGWGLVLGDGNAFGVESGPECWGGRGNPPCDIPSGCCSFTGPWTVTRSSLRMLRRVAAFCRPLRPLLPLVSFPRSRSPVVGVPGLCWM